MKILWVSYPAISAFLDLLLRGPVLSALLIADSNHILAFVFEGVERLYVFEPYSPRLIGIHCYSFVGDDQLRPLPYHSKEGHDGKDAEHDDQDHRTCLVCVAFILKHVNTPYDEGKAQRKAEVEFPKRLIYFDFFCLVLHD